MKKTLLAILAVLSLSAALSGCIVVPDGGGGGGYHHHDHW